MTNIFTSIRRLFQGTIQGNLLIITTGEYNPSDDDGFIGRYKVVKGRVRRKILGKYPYKGSYKVLLIPITNEAEVEYKETGSSGSMISGQVFTKHILLIKKRYGKKKVIKLSR